LLQNVNSRGESGETGGNPRKAFSMNGFHNVTLWRHGGNMVAKVAKRWRIAIPVTVGKATTSKILRHFRHFRQGYLL